MFVRSVCCFRNSSVCWHITPCSPLYPRRHSPLPSLWERQILHSCFAFYHKMNLSTVTYFSKIYYIIIIMALQSFVGPCPLFLLSWSCTQLVGLLGRWISPSQGLFLHTEQQKRRINTHNADIHALSGIRTHDLSVRTSEDTLCLRPRGHCDRPEDLLLNMSSGS
jgi:hypothetical protein